MHHNRMKRSFAFLLTMAMLLSLCLGAAGAQYPCVGFAARELTVTRSASATGETLYTVPAGDAVYVTGDSGDYYIIEYDGQPGYAAKSAVRLAGEVLVNNPDGAWLGAYTALRQGDEGQLVRELQSALIEAGFLSGSADGKYGQRTAQAVADFQAANGLNNSGYADIATQGTLYETKITNSRGKAVSVTILPSVDGLSVSSGKTGAPVESLQAALTDLTAEGQLIQAESFQFYIPADWETVELNDEEIAEGYVFAAASADGANSLIITYAAMDAAMTAEEAQPGLAEVYPTATVQDLNGTSVVAFHDAEEDVLGIVVMDTVDAGYYIFMFTPASDEAFLPVADAIAASFTAAQ